ncbi:BspA family leucine-rich repeat surface protein [Mangrovivirga sp. M17]|uniref:BspA family leucine-rich repeat surface protein n=1 Tax=Mangrovivirga halotolerans TaxID=2993936 RepID=A0ABT3RU54_9BACT|nr:BspA family leucine-rich repeat surface protein [Mangrovivirga halotolerans]MCX2745310.1 BspA family leucine-rich repeat surface protein [Mangrovivirga halotolerans]
MNKYYFFLFALILGVSSCKDEEAAIISYTLTTQAEGSGSVNPNSKKVKSGETIEVTATPELGSEFTGWTGDINSSDNPLVLTMDKDLNITANFTKSTYTFTAEVNGPGSVSLSTKEVTFGEKVEITATPEEGYIFHGWSGDVNTIENPLSVTINRNMNIKAQFIDGNGIIKLAENGVTLYCEQEAKIGLKYPYNGEMYEIVDNSRLKSMTYYSEDMTKVITTKVTSMEDLFLSNSTFNSDISSWDVSNVTSMKGMFDGAESFNQDLSNWDVSNVTTMNAMFENAKSFDQDLSSWNVGKVENMVLMFQDAIKFNQDLSSWDVSQVTSCTNFANQAESWSKPKPNLECAQ